MKLKIIISKACYGIMFLYLHRGVTINALLINWIP